MLRTRLLSCAKTSWLRRRPRKIDISPLMTNVYPLQEGVLAFKDQENNKDGKMLKVFLES